MTPIKNEDLRIGNLVFDSTGYTTKVESIIPEHERIRYGIPLSKKWFKALGFTRQNNAWIDPKENNTDFSVWNPDGDDTFDLNGEMFTPRIQFVHQLQNLYYALTGLELTAS